VGGCVSAGLSAPARRKTPVRCAIMYWGYDLLKRTRELLTSKRSGRQNVDRYDVSADTWGLWVFWGRLRGVAQVLPIYRAKPRL